MSNLKQSNPEFIREEASTSLGDARRTARLGQALEAIAVSPDAALPEIFADRSALQGAYRLFRSEAVDWRDIEFGHTEKTLKRCAELPQVLLIHDTTDFSFKLHDPDWLRDGLVRLSSQRQGFSWHACLAASNGEEAVPLGLVASQPFVHRKHLQDPQTEAYWRERGGVFENEKKRWFDLVANARACFEKLPCVPLHVMDREADSFSLLNYLLDSDDRFVVRVKATNRQLHGTKKNLSQALDEVAFAFRRKVRLGFRTLFRNAHKRRKHPPRKEREAVLQFRATRVTIGRGSKKDAGYIPPGLELAESLTLNVVEAVETTPPEGEEPIRWLLFTSEPIDSVADILHVVDSYRRRWLIEEYYKSLKTGCRMEERQFRSADTILSCLATLSIVAWWLLAVRAVATGKSEAGWEVALTPLAFAILRESVTTMELKDDAKLVHVLLAIASLGGHLQHNGPPGWLTLMRGMRKLTERVQGAILFAQVKAQGGPQER